LNESFIKLCNRITDVLRKIDVCEDAHEFSRLSEELKRLFDKLDGFGRSEY